MTKYELSLPTVHMLPSIFNFLVINIALVERIYDKDLVPGSEICQKCLIARITSLCALNIPIMVFRVIWAV